MTFNQLWLTFLVFFYASCAIAGDSRVGHYDSLQLLSPNGNGNYVELKAANLTAVRSLTFPDSNGTSGFFLSTNGSGILSWVASSGGVPTSRQINTTSPLTGGGDLTANRTIAIPPATTSASGYLTSTDWNTFNGKQVAANYPVAPGTTTINGLATWGAANGSTMLETSSFALSGSATSSGTTTLVGTGTVFLTQLKIGQTFVFNSVPYTVSAIASDTSLTASASIPTFTGAMTGVTTLSPGGVLGPLNGISIAENTAGANAVTIGVASGAGRALVVKSYSTLSPVTVDVNNTASAGNAIGGSTNGGGVGGGGGWGVSGSSSNTIAGFGQISGGVLGSISNTATGAGVAAISGAGGEALAIGNGASFNLVGFKVASAGIANSYVLSLPTGIGAEGQSMVLGPVTTTAGFPTTTVPSSATMGWDYPMTVGNLVNGATTGDILFTSTTDTLDRDPVKFFWKKSTHRLGLGTQTPVAGIEVVVPSGPAVVTNASVGVGATPLFDAQFSVHEAADLNLAIRNADPGFTPGVPGILIDSVSDDYSTNKPIFIRGAGINLLGGLVGIGTFAPTHELDLVGTQTISGALSVGKSTTPNVPLDVVGAAHLHIATDRNLDIENAAGFPGAPDGILFDSINDSNASYPMTFRGSAIDFWDGTTTKELSIGTHTVSILDGGGFGGNVPHAMPSVASTSSTSATSAVCSYSCAAGLRVVGGGCSNTMAISLINSYPSADDTWSCAYTTALGDCTATAICAAY